MLSDVALLPPPLANHAMPALLPPAPAMPDQTILDLPARCGLSAVWERLHQGDRNKWDLAIPRERLMLSGGRLVLPEEFRDEYPECLDLSGWATMQACQRLGIPAQYFVRCPPPLRDVQFNHWLWKGTQVPDDPLPDEEDAASDLSHRSSAEGLRPWLLRGKGDVVRAVLSDRYAPLDNADLLATLTPFLEGRFEVKSLALTPESLHLRLVDPRLAREVLPDDRLMVGLHVANSEVGRRSVTVDALVYRLVCQNGLIRLVKGRSLLRQRHVSWDRSHFADALSRALLEAITAGAGLIERLSLATRMPVPDVEGLILALSRQAGLTQRVQDGVRRALLATPASQQETVYGFVQALTLTAQDLPPDDRYDLEVVAGRLLDEGLPSPAKPAASFPIREPHR